MSERNVTKLAMNHFVAANLAEMLPSVTVVLARYFCTSNRLTGCAALLSSKIFSGSHPEQLPSFKIFLKYRSVDLAKV